MAVIEEEEGKEQKEGGKGSHATHVLCGSGPIRGCEALVRVGSATEHRHVEPPQHCRVLEDCGFGGGAEVIRRMSSREAREGEGRGRSQQPRWGGGLRRTRGGLRLGGGVSGLGAEAGGASAERAKGRGGSEVPLWPPHTVQVAQTYT